uniref:Methyltransferase domain-containing protein n=1 Tax=Brassica oleracea var. oleracea TaxID=109376 RepID=A0A0D3D5G5_BRAOL
MGAAQSLLGKDMVPLPSNPKHMVPSLTEKGARFLFTRFLRHFISTGCVTVYEEGGTVFTFKGKDLRCNLESVMEIHNPHFYWKVMTQADLGLADAYINGDFSFVNKETGLLNLIMARIEKNHEVLEIGCGWGTLAIEVVKNTGCKYTGITLSIEQLKYAEEKVKEAGLQDRITFELCDYRQLSDAKKYDRIISCSFGMLFSEMIEHVGHEFMDTFFSHCEAALAEDGIFVLQFISIPEERYNEYRLNSDFIKEYIFPGGCLPSLARVISAMASSSRLRQIMDLGFDDKFIRTWEYYFDYCAAGFKTLTLEDYQVVFSRPGNVAAFGDPFRNFPSAHN